MAAFGTPLAEADEVTVQRASITASFTQAPAAHDGSGKFLLDLEFSHEPERFSYRTVRDGLFDVEGGRIENARRLERGRNLHWEISVVPGGDGAVTLDARETVDCAAEHAACDAEGRKFNGDLSLTVPGPMTLPTVSISASSTSSVTEGTATAFVLARTGATDAALTVAVAVSETGAALSGTVPTSATFAAGASTATLSVATEDDEAVEEASTVTATVSSGTGYTVSGTSGSADVVVNDDDAAPVVTTASPIVVVENATAVATLAASDADTDTNDLSWSISGGARPGGVRADGGRRADVQGGEGL